MAGFNYPAIMVTDTAFYRNPAYHTAAETRRRTELPRDGRRGGRVVPCPDGIGIAVTDS